VTSSATLFKSLPSVLHEGEESLTKLSAEDHFKEHTSALLQESAIQFIDFA